MPLLERPKTKRLHCRDPRIVQNYVNRFVKLASKARLLERVIHLDSQAQYPAPTKLAHDYETLDAIRCDITTAAKKNVESFAQDRLLSFQHFRRQ